MKKILAFMSQKARYARGFLPMRLPAGIPQFDRFCAFIFDTYGVPDYPGYRQAIATMIMHLGPTKAYKPPYFFALSVRKAQANQTAHEVISRIREAEHAKEAEAQKAAQEKATAEAASTQSEQVTDGGVLPNG